MLKKLTVQNYALIDQLQLQFGRGLNIITGETGAGKSVLMGALGLLLGDRADSSSLLDKTKKCVIEGEFLVSKNVKTFLEVSELDAEDELIIHREINKDGKSRSFINDTPVNLTQLRELGNILVDIHSQHETLLLNQSDFQLSVVDAFASHSKLLADYSLLFKHYRSLKQELNRLYEEEKKQRTDQDYLQFQFSELEDAKLQTGEQNKLEEDISALSHAEEIKSGIDHFSNEISGSENNILSKLNVLTNTVAGLGKYATGLEESVNRLKAVQIELKDIEYEINNISETINPDPKKVEIINDRLSLIYKLQQKHRLDTIEELVQLRVSINNKLLSFSSLEEQIEKTVKETELLFQNVNIVAEKISTQIKYTHF